MGRKSALRRENTLDSARIPRASKLLICGLFQKGRVLAQDGDRASRFSHAPSSSGLVAAASPGYYVRASRLVHDLAVARGDGSYARVVSRLAKLDLLAIDDWLLHPLKDADRRDLMEVIEERAERGSTLIATQLPVKQWHTAIGDPNHADALCDRVLHRAHRITLKGASLRKNQNRTRDDHGGCMSTQGSVGRCLREREGRFAAFIKPAPYGTAQPILVVAPVAEIRSETTERRLTYTSTLR